MEDVFAFIGFGVLALFVLLICVSFVVGYGKVILEVSVEIKKRITGEWRREQEHAREIAKQRRIQERENDKIAEQQRREYLAAKILEARRAADATISLLTLIGNGGVTVNCAGAGLFYVSLSLSGDVTFPCKVPIGTVFTCHDQTVQNMVCITDFILQNAGHRTSNSKVWHNLVPSACLNMLRPQPNQMHGFSIDQMTLIPN
jgi:hypothetical protein